jgi:hypothetical protein
MIERQLLEPPASYFVFPVSLDHKGRGVIGSRFGCDSYEDATEIASDLISKFPGVLIFDANDLQLVDVFGDVPETLIKDRMTIR